MKLKQMKMAFFMMLLMMCLWVVNINEIRVFAEESDNESYVEIKAEYSDYLEPQKGDVFALTYAYWDDDSDNTATITVDAYDLIEESKKIYLPHSLYRITFIEYQGNNQGIIEYGVISKFNARKEGDYIIIAIGTERTEHLKSRYQDTYCVYDINDHILIDDEGNESTYDDRYEEQIEKEKELQKMYSNGEIDASFGMKTENDNNTSEENVSEEEIDVDDEIITEDTISDNNNEKGQTIVNEESQNEKSEEVINTEEKNTNASDTSKKDNSKLNVIIVILCVIIILIVIFLTLISKKKKRN